MNKLLNYCFLLSIIVIPASCIKDSYYLADLHNIKRVEYYDSTGTLNGYFKNLIYSGDLLTRIDMISNNSQMLEYQNKKILKFRNVLVQPFPVNTAAVEVNVVELKYAATGMLEQVVMNANGTIGPGTETDTISFTWKGSRLEKANIRSVHVQTRQIISEEQLSYTYTGNNITKCVIEGGIYAYSRGAGFWKDSVEFTYDRLPNRFAENGLQFFHQEFSDINAYQQRPLRVDNRYDLNQDPFWFDPAFLAFIQSENNVLSMKSAGGTTHQHFTYITGPGSLQNRIVEIKINNRTAARYFYK